MKRFRGKVILTLITKPIVVEAETESDAYTALKEIPDTELLKYVDSVRTDVFNDNGRDPTVVRVSYTEPVTYVAPVKEEAMKAREVNEKIDTLIDILKQNADAQTKMLGARTNEGK